MEENKNAVPEELLEKDEQSFFDFQLIYTTLILNWKWFVFSLIVCLGAAYAYLRYTTPMYQAYAKLLIKDDERSPRGNSIQNAANLGLITNSNGIDNEMELLTSHSIAEASVRDLKIYVNYFMEGKVRDHELYRTQPFNIDVDAAHLNRLDVPMRIIIEKTSVGYSITGTYYVTLTEGRVDGPFTINKSVSQIPTVINTKAGTISITRNMLSMVKDLNEGQILKVKISSPKMAAYKYIRNLAVNQTSKTTTIAQLTLEDQIPQRAIDYLKQMAVAYNRQANEDKNEIAQKTESFINSRLEKINAELGSTEGALENYKRRNNMVELKMNAGQAVANQDQYAQKLAEANAQVALLNEMSQYMNQPGNRYEALPSSVGLTDQNATVLINKYNEIAMERKRLLRSASESSPTVTPLTAQLDDLTNSIRRAMNQSRRGMEIQRNAVASQLNKYSGEVGATPEQERMLTQIGRQQEVKSGLYLMLLQKREENSISLAATADKGRLIDDPEFAGKVSPKSSIVILIALLLGLSIPALILFILQFFHYRIEGHMDVARLTTLPIIADIPVASESAKTKADIVVHENKNNLMEEIFRSLRTNLQFMLKENEKVIAFTSSTTGEGKTFTAANLAVSLALLGRKVILVGLDIRKPRLAELFELDDHQHGITNLLIQSHPSVEDIKKQILSSGINNHLELLMAGPTPPNPAELLARKSLDTIFEQLRMMYDYIIIDTAPVGLVTDTLQISRVVDATVVMTRADYTAKESIGLINSLADSNKMPNVCIVINGIDMSKKKHGYYYGYGKYAKYGRYARLGSNYGSYGRYGSYGSYGTYGSYGNYGSYGSYGNYSNSHYGDKNDDSIKK
ncbi:polysaccharide biosynthesis tyrosine autokinase [Prevotella sp. A2931]|uniref:non-specific protein-tyrosine kinase n=1 Tax=Prevotella illustrans TaxID=2800387 RepID=A0ABS3M5A3_9BACT|nr:MULTISPECIES: polysaccharide biosynthesis tyrosine autokinase [Prevotella]MBO1363314.1 polysaccharide biosynthesis tyrosine autokinase [Prevotella illustrans]PTL25818.1 capsid assembly protein [Prevotella sp. oral taxon 820]